MTSMTSKNSTVTNERKHKLMNQNEPPLKVKRLTPTARLPERAHATDAGLDLFADRNVMLEPGDYHCLETGIAIAIPLGYVGRIAPRSGLAVMRGMDVLAGVIDHGYTGEVKVCLINHGHQTTEIKTGDKIAQLLIQPASLCGVVEVDSLDETERGAGGFGSTDKGNGDER